MKYRLPETHTHRRLKTTMMFADAGCFHGKVVGKLKYHVKPTEFINFLKRIDTQVLNELDSYLLLDDYDIHKMAYVKSWLLRRPRSLLLHPDL